MPGVLPIDRTLTGLTSEEWNGASRKWDTPLN